MSYRHGVAVYCKQNHGLYLHLSLKELKHLYNVSVMYESSSPGAM